MGGPQAGRPLGGAGQPHMLVGRALPWWRVSWSLLEPSHAVPVVEFHNFF
jgi:hypothetical protein